MIFNLIMREPQVGVALLGIVVLAISVHEMAHAWMALRCGDDTAARMGRLTINPTAHFDPVGLAFIIFAMFGWGKPVPYNPLRLRHIRRDSMLIAAAGPVSNLIQALILALLFRLITQDTVWDFFGILPFGNPVRNASVLVFTIGVYINLGLAFFNLIPLFPLDGDKILAGLLPYRQAMQFEEFRKYSTGILVFLLLSGFLLNFPILDIYFRLTASPLSTLLLGVSLSGI